MSGAKDSSNTDPLNIQDYLDASSHASTRARTVVVIMVFASVRVFAGLLNSLESHWMEYRLQLLSDINDPYTQGRIGNPPDPSKFPQAEKDPAYQRAVDLHRQKYLAFYSSFAKQHVENAYAIKVPFFGISFDVNDLGLLGGVAFVIILVLFRLCLSREADNLKLSFTEAKKLGQLSEFYHLLAMSQVFTVPRTAYINRGKFLIYVPKVICLFPLFVDSAVIVHDLITLDIGQRLGKLHSAVETVFEILLLLLVVILTWMVITRMFRID